jgi:hypothetical protein
VSEAEPDIAPWVSLAAQVLSETVEKQHKLTALLHNTIKGFPEHVQQNVLEAMKVSSCLCIQHRQLALRLPNIAC